MLKTAFFSIALIGSIVFIWLFLNRMQATSEVYRYLPQLRGRVLSDIQFEKLNADPSYLIPYNVLIAFKTNSPSIIDDLQLQGVEETGTSKLKTQSWTEEYELYFSMESVNAIRYESIRKQMKNVKWWNVEKCLRNYAAPYLDSNNIRSVGILGQKNNGRVVCCKKADIYFILIECWG